MPRQPTPKNYTDADLDGPIIDEATPAAESLLLAEADAWLVQAAITPYCGCARMFNSGTKDSSDTELDRYFAVVVAPGAKHGRMAISRSWPVKSLWQSGDPITHEAWTNDGGTGVNDVITLAIPISKGTGHYVDLRYHGSLRDIKVTGSNIDDTPGAPIDRQFELQSLLLPTVEPCYVRGAAGVSMAISEQVEDLETL